VPNPEDADHLPIVVQAVHDPVVAHPDAPDPFRAAQERDAGRARIVRESVDGPGDPAPERLLQIRQLTER
jgi:hypothetical protein